MWFTVKQNLMSAFCWKQEFAEIDESVGSGYLSSLQFWYNIFVEQTLCLFSGNFIYTAHFITSKLKVLYIQNED